MWKSFARLREETNWDQETNSRREGFAFVGDGFIIRLQGLRANGLFRGIRSRCLNKDRERRLRGVADSLTYLVSEKTLLKHRVMNVKRPQRFGAQQARKLGRWERGRPAEGTPCPNGVPANRL